MLKKGVFAGTFDPVTKGHIDIIERALKIVDFLIIAVYKSPNKELFLSMNQRLDLICGEVSANKKLFNNIKVIDFDSLLVDVAKKEGAIVNIRGVRSFKDYEYESAMHCINNKLLCSFDTILLPASTGYEHISSSAVREIASLGGDLSMFVSKRVASLMKKICSEENDIT